MYLSIGDGMGFRSGFSSSSKEVKNLYLGTPSRITKQAGIDVSSIAPHSRDFMDPTMDRTKHILNYLMPILEQVDRELHDFLIRYTAHTHTHSAHTLCTHTCTPVQINAHCLA